MCVGQDGCVEVPLSLSLYVCGVGWGGGGAGGGKPGETSNPLNNQVTILATHKCTNPPSTLPQGLLDVLRKICNLWKPACFGGK